MADEPNASDVIDAIDEAHRAGWYKHFRPCDPVALNEAAERDLHKILCVKPTTPIVKGE